MTDEQNRKSIKAVLDYLDSIPEPGDPELERVLKMCRGMTYGVAIGELNLRVQKNTAQIYIPRLFFYCKPWPALVIP